MPIAITQLRASIVGWRGCATTASPIRLLPGSHTVTLREALLHKPDRQVSNTLRIEFAEHEKVMVRATSIDGKLCLQVNTSP